MYPSMGGNRVSNGALDDLSFDMNLDPDSAQRIRQIVAAKENAVNKEDYDAAKRLKAAEGELCGWVAFREVITWKVDVGIRNTITLYLLPIIIRYIASCSGSVYN